MAKLEESLLTDIKHNGDFELTPGGDIAIVSGVENVRLWVFRTIATSLRSVVHRAGYGVGLKSYHNAINSRDNQRDLALRIEAGLVADPRIVAVNSVTVESPDFNPENLTIGVSAQIRGFGDFETTFKPFEIGLRL